MVTSYYSIILRIHSVVFPLVLTLMSSFPVYAVVPQCPPPTPLLDADGDGYDDTMVIGGAYDLFPTDPTEWYDTDLDGIGNNTDLDDDGRILVPDGDEVALTGRTPQDDVIDVSLILLFGGMEVDILTEIL